MFVDVIHVISFCLNNKNICRYSDVMFSSKLLSSPRADIDSSDIDIHFKISKNSVVGFHKNIFFPPNVCFIKSFKMLCLQLVTPIIGHKLMLLLSTPNNKAL